MPKKGIITNQKINPQKQKWAIEFRKKPTPAEARLWQRLRANRLAGWHFRRQQIIRGFIVDFYCHQADLIVEVDGPIHRFQVQHDKNRERVFIEMGLRIVRFKNEEVFSDLEEVCRRILETLQAKP